MTPFSSPPKNFFFKKLIELITYNFWLKFLSLIFAIVLFFIVRADRELSLDRVAKVKVITRHDMDVVGPSERFLNVTLRQRNSIFSSPPSDSELTGEVDLTNETPGRIRVKITRGNFPHLSKGFSLFIEQPVLDIELDKILQKTLPIQVILKGEPKTGFTVTKVSVTPERISVRGTAKQIARIQSIPTLPVNIDSLSSTLSTLTSLDLSDLAGVSVPDGENVEAHVEISQRKMTRVFRSIPIEIRGVPHDVAAKMELRPRYIDAEIAGESHVLRSLNPSDVRAFLDTSTPSNEWQEIRVILKIPAGTSLVKMTPDSVFSRILK